MVKFKLSGGGGLFVAFVALNVAYADDVYHLGRIEVVATEEKETIDSNDTLNIITAQDIERNSASTVAESLRFTPGMFYEPPFCSLQSNKSM